MVVEIEHIDPYRQRYVTVAQIVTNGLQVTTEIYTPYIYGESLQTRLLEHNDGKKSIEVYGMVTKIVQILAGSGLEVVIVAEGHETEATWIEMWRSCETSISSKFAYTMDCCIVSTISYNIISGPAFVSEIDSTSPTVVWADVNPAGEIISPVGDTAFEFIDVWS